MGPCRIGHGKNEKSLGVAESNELQWGRAALGTESACSNTVLFINSGFNGAVPHWARKVAAACSTFAFAVGFNGAVPHWARKGIYLRWLNAQKGLQWGRAALGTESTISLITDCAP